MSKLIIALAILFVNPVIFASSIQCAGPDQKQLSLQTSDRVETGKFNASIEISIPEKNIFSSGKNLGCLLGSRNSIARFCHGTESNPQDQLSVSTETIESLSSTGVEVQLQLIHFKFTKNQTEYDLSFNKEFCSFN